MPIAIEPWLYGRAVLPESTWEALYGANHELIDLIQEEIVAVAAGKPFGATELQELLPLRYRDRYDLAFLQKFLICAVTVGIKFRLPGYYRLGSTGETIAFYIMEKLAESGFAASKR